MKDVGLPPKSADEYKYEPPKEIKEAGFDMPPDVSKRIKDRVFAKGYTNGQYEEMMAMYYEELGDMVAASASWRRQAAARPDGALQNARGYG